MPYLSVNSLLNAYSIGVFPMAEFRDDPNLFWVDPQTRGIIHLSRFHVPKKLRKIVRGNKFLVTFDKDFSAVIRECAAPTARRPQTWINNQIKEIYTSLHLEGYCHSVECWRKNQLVGGLYGIALKGIFFGESMFSKETDASKVALVHLAARLSAGGFDLIDTQFITRHLCRFGAIEVSRKKYHKLLSSALKIEASFNCNFGPNDINKILQQ